MSENLGEEVVASYFYQIHSIIGWKTTITADSWLMATCEELTEIGSVYLPIFGFVLMEFLRTN